MDDVGQIERNSQNRVVKLFQERLNYRYLGNWEDRVGNSNVEEDLLRAYLKEQGVSKVLIDKAVFELTKVAGSQVHSLYETNKKVYRMLRFGVGGWKLQ